VQVDVDKTVGLSFLFFWDIVTRRWVVGLHWTFGCWNWFHKAVLKRRVKSPSDEALYLREWSAESHRCESLTI